MQLQIIFGLIILSAVYSKESFKYPENNLIYTKHNFKSNEKEEEEELEDEIIYYFKYFFIFFFIIVNGMAVYAIKVKQFCLYSYT